MTEQEKALLAMVVDGELKKLPTADLIAELERRRPCLECARNSNSIGCDGCAYNWPPIQSNFKPRPTTEPLPDQTKGEGL